MEELRIRSNDRGQLILVAAIGLAVLLTLMTLALNTAVFGEIHAAQSDNSLKEERGAVQYHYSVERGVSGLIDSLNEEYDEYGELERELHDAVAVWNDLSSSEQLRDGTITNSSLERVTYESRVIQDESRAFTDRSGRTEWGVTEDVSDVRGFEMNVSGENLTATGDCAGGGACFGLEVEGANGNSWQLFVHDDGGVTITVDSPSGGTETYTATETPVRIDVAEGSFDVGGSEDEFTTFLQDGGIEAPYTLTYTNADNVSGTYELIVGGKIVDETIDDDERYGTDGSPRIEAKIDAADVSVRYRSTDLTYGTEIVVLPGEIDG